MIWKPAAVRLANVKAKNVGSYFDAQQILTSPALNQVRAHKFTSKHLRFCSISHQSIQNLYAHYMMSPRLCLDVELPIFLFAAGERFNRKGPAITDTFIYINPNYLGTTYLSIGHYQPFQSYLQVWRLRSYLAEKSIGAAKPLIFVKEKLVLPAGQCQRLM